MCMDGTRMRLRQDILDWLRGVGSEERVSLLCKLFWVYGLAGSGKSSLANTIAEMIENDKGFDLSCFFCKRDDESLSKPERLFPTLAFRLCRLYASYRAALVSLLSSPEGDGLPTAGIEKQFKMLFRDLLPKTTQPPRIHIIIIDALDECGAPKEQAILANYLLALSTAMPWIKVLVTSRKEPAIKKVFSSDGRTHCIDINLEEQTNEDICRYVMDKSKTLELSLSTIQAEALVKQATGLFIWCSTLFKYLERSDNPIYDLNRFISGADAREPLEQLYALYDNVVMSAAEGTSRDLQQAILGIIFVSAGNRPLSARAISVLLTSQSIYERGSEDAVRRVTQRFHAVLYESGASSGGAIRAYHPSFYDYIQGKLEAGSFTIGLAGTHQLMFKGSLETMHRGLKFNICELEDSYRKNKDVPDLAIRISNFIPEALQYSSLFWFSHLSQSNLAPGSEEVTSEVSRLFGSLKALFWLEVLSLLGAIGHGIGLLRECAAFFAVRCILF